MMTATTAIAENTEFQYLHPPEGCLIRSRWQKGTSTTTASWIWLLFKLETPVRRLQVQ